MSKIIGITGGIATGKSTVSAFLKQKGYLVIEADRLVFDLQKKGCFLYQALVAVFGEAILQPDKELDRKKLAQLLFSDERSMSQSKQAQDDIIKRELEMQKRRAEQTESLFFMDIPLLFERGYDSWFDEIWLLYLPEKQQIDRLMKRAQLSEQEALKRLQAQFPFSEKQHLATHLIDNSGSRLELIRQVEHLLAAEEKENNEG